MRRFHKITAVFVPALVLAGLAGCWAGVPEGWVCTPFSDERRCPGGEVCQVGEDGPVCRGVCDSSDDCPVVTDGCVEGACRPYAQSCSTADECLPEFYCNAGACRRKELLGAACGTQSDACKSGLCVDGVCCNDACDGACETCLVGDGVGDGDDGFCAAVPAGSDPDSECGPAACDGAGACFAKEQGTACSERYECSSGSCPDGVCCADTCSGVCQECTSGTCVPIANATDPDNECESYATCNGANACWARALGDPCSADHECVNGFCNPSSICALQCTSADDCGGNDCRGGRCCTGPCAGTCMSCNENETGDDDGACAPVIDGTDPNDSYCPGPTACTGSGACYATENGVGCTNDCECTSGFCTDSVCCNIACTGSCRACDGVDTDPPGAVGTCTLAAKGHDPAEECDGPLACDDGGACYDNGPGVSCEDDYQCTQGRCCGTCGFGWTSESSGTTADLYGVWGSSPNDIFAVGAGGVIRYSSGSSWSGMSSGTTKNLLAVHGSSSSNVIAVGVGGTIIRFDGSSWSPMTSNTTETLNAVWVVSSSSAYAAGYNETILRLSGSTWSAMTIEQPDPQFHFKDLWRDDATGRLVAAVSHSSCPLAACRLEASAWELVGSTWGEIGDFGGGEAVSVTIHPTLGTMVSTSAYVCCPFRYSSRLNDGTGWRSIPDALFHLWAGTGKILGAGQPGTSSPTPIGAYDGFGWQNEMVDRPGLLDLWGFSDCDAIAVGNGGTIVRF